MSLRLAYPGGEELPLARSWSGIVSQAELVGAEPTGISTYLLCVVPPLWLLAQRKNYRVFQHKSAVDIATALLSEWGIEHTWQNAEEHARYEIRTQYDETDHAFLSRILEEDGISYFFDHESGSRARC